MATNYPASIDNIINLPTVIDNRTGLSGASINILRDTIIAIETELGVKPSGVNSTIKARLDNLQFNSITLGGDIGGNTGAPKIVGIQGFPISMNVPTLGEVLGWDGSHWTPTTPGAAFIAGGDLSGSSVNQKVISINGATVPVAGSLTIGNVLQVNGSSALNYSLIANTNVDINAAILGTKINPNFGTQTVLAPNYDFSGAITIGTVNSTSLTFGKIGLLTNITGNAFITDTGQNLPSNMLFDNAPGSFVSGINHITSTIVPLGSYDTALRIDHVSTGGGSWDVSGAITGNSSIFVNNSAGSRGTHEALSGYIKGLGVGDAIPFSFVVDTWGGATPAEGASSVSIPESGAVGEFDLAQGGVRYSAFTGATPTEAGGSTNQIFRGTVSGSPAANATTINYSVTANADKLGCRFILNKNHTTTVGHISVIAPDFPNERTLITFVGVAWNSSAIGRYLKIGTTQDFYAVTNMSQLQGDDIFLNGFGIGHWYRIKSVPAANQLMIEGIWDIVGFSVGYGLLPNAPYIVMDGAEIQSFTSSSFVIPSNTYTWSNGDILYSPPHHYQAALGFNIILQKLFKTSKYAINAQEGLRVISRGIYPLDHGLRLGGASDGYGGFNIGIKMEGFDPTIGIDMTGVAPTIASVRVNQDDRIVFDASSLYPSIRGIGTDGLHIEGQPGQHSIWATDNTNSDFIVSHTAVGRIDFEDNTADFWLTQRAGSDVWIGPGGFPNQAITITGSQFITNKGRRLKITTTTTSYVVLITDDVIQVEGLSAPINITLPSSPTNGDVYTIKDAQGLANTHNITILGNGHNIDASSSFVLNNNYENITVIFDSAANRWSAITSKVIFGGDLSASSDNTSQTVISISGTSPILITPNDLTWISSATPTLNQNTVAGTGATNGHDFAIQSQAGQQQTGSNANNNGGDLNLVSGAAGTGGSGAAGTSGTISLKPGGNTRLSVSNTATTITNNIVQSNGAVTLTANNTSSWSTSAGSITINPAAALTLTGGATSVWSTTSGSISITPTTALTLTGGAASVWSTSVGALTITGAAASTWSTSAGALTLTSAAAATWSTAAGTLIVQGASGVIVQDTSLTSIDLGVSVANQFTVKPAGSSRFAVSDTTTAIGNNLTQSNGAVTLTSNNTSSWSTTAGSITINPTTALTLTGGAASTWSTSVGALTLTSAAAATWSTSAGALIVQGASGVTVQDTSSTSIDVGVTGANTFTVKPSGTTRFSVTNTTTTINGSVSQSNGSITLTANNTSSWSTSAGSITINPTTALTLTGGAASVWSTTAGAITLTAAATSTWSVSTGTLTLQGASGVTVQDTSSTSIDVGITAANTFTVKPSGTTRFSVTNTTTTVNGALSQSNGAVSLTANAASSLTTSSGALTLTSAAAATWSTSAGALTINGTAGINLQSGASTISDFGVTSSTALTMNVAGITYKAAVVSPLISQTTAASDVATTNITIQSQAPFASAVTNLVPGNILLNTPLPIGAGAFGNVSVQSGGTTFAQIGQYASGSTFGGIWLGSSVTQSQQNVTLVARTSGSINTNLNTPTGGIISLTINGSTGTGLDMNSTTFALQPAAFTWNQGASAPVISQATKTTDAAANSFTIHAQSAETTAVTNVNGGILVLQGGAAKTNGTTGLRGGVRDQIGADTAETMIECAEVAVGQRVVALAQVGSGITSTQIPASGGDGVVWIGNAQTAPVTAGAPTGGAVIYAQSGALKAITPSGTITTLAAADPHCPNCGSDFMCEYDNDNFGYLAMCLKCLSDELGQRNWIVRQKS